MLQYASEGRTNFALTNSFNETEIIPTRSTVSGGTFGTRTFQNTHHSFLVQNAYTRSPTPGIQHYRAEAEKTLYARVFEADLERQLANMKRRYENRQDLAYSKLVSHPATIASECLEPFDTNLTKSCGDGKKWASRYYFDRDLRVCRMYWHGGCFSSCRNDFTNEDSCRWKCMGQHTEPVSRACLDPFDWVYLEDCRHGEFSDRYYFNHERYGNCLGNSHNIYPTLELCQSICERRHVQRTPGAIKQRN
ncbi:EGF_CA [Parelaphostrongylus tenuis]|uniref:EGF_CA n=1 Tax=Parelaphostrongylus tenuis TaxID=148309 RepID=A0AAD5WET8_PARTN|nr:EGF_CA [Parelaphostrongylus tenuis]